MAGAESLASCEPLQNLHWLDCSPTAETGHITWNSCQPHIFRADAGVIVLSWLFLSATYGPKHWLGAGLCVAGVALLVSFDAWQQGSAEMQHPLLGDLLVVLGASCYAVCNVLQEKMLGRSLQASASTENGLGTVFLL